MLALLLALAALSPAAAPEVRADERLSLEELLERVRAERERMFERLRPRVEAAISALEALEPPVPKRVLAERVDALVALGTEATPLLAAHLDPGPAPLDRERLRARQVANALARMDTTPVTAELLELVERGSDEARRNAITALANTRQPERVRPALLRLFEAAGGELREVSLRALLDLGGSLDEGLLDELLSGREPALLDIALQALSETRDARAAPKVLGLVQRPDVASPHLRALLDYYLAVPGAVGGEELAGLLQLARGRGPLPQRVAILDNIRRWNVSLSADLRRAMEPLLSANDREVREAALAALASLGDKASKRELIKGFDLEVGRNTGWWKSYARRAEAYLRIGDYDEAIADFTRALSLGSEDPSPQPDVYVGLARAYARKRKLKDAAGWLAKAPISRPALDILAQDPDFAELRESRYGKDLWK